MQLRKLSRKIGEADPSQWPCVILSAFLATICQITKTGINLNVPLPMSVSEELLRLSVLTDTVKYANGAHHHLFKYNRVDDSPAVGSMAVLVRYIWLRQWNPVTVLFILSRYSPCVDVPATLYYSLGQNISLKQCSHLHGIFTCTAATPRCLPEQILTPQLGVILSIVTIHLFSKTAIYTSPPLAVAGCFLAQGEFILVAVPYVVTLLNDIAIVAYSVWIGLKRFRHSSSPLVVTLYRDGAMYFIILLAVSTINIVVLAAGPCYIADPKQEGMPGLLNAVLSTRVLLQVRHTADKPVNLSLNLETTSEVQVRASYMPD
ncbi:hypothetical protein GGX14DRAFT_540297 [Mycena pura]|uniref:Uncharacterized protein n=1 Tax=Mycena pura TaxID=153505 RepID=A0AAD6YMH5_9AGAR|nr:hypothetical protein GGX14DRAFT_540297 [Mycena pura]